MPKFAKGSQAAKDHMAKLRKMRKSKNGNGEAAAPPAPEAGGSLLHEPKKRLVAPFNESRMGSIPPSGPVVGAGLPQPSQVPPQAPRKKLPGLVAPQAVGMTRTPNPLASRATSSPPTGGTVADQFKKFKRHVRTQIPLAQSAGEKAHMLRIVRHQSHGIALRDFQSEEATGGFHRTLRNMLSSAPQRFGALRGALEEKGMSAKAPGGGGFAGSGRVPGTQSSQLAPHGASLAAQFRILKNHAKVRQITAPPEEHQHMKRIRAHRGHLKGIADMRQEHQKAGPFAHTLRSMFDTAPVPLPELKHAITGARTSNMLERVPLAPQGGADVGDRKGGSLKGSLAATQSRKKIFKGRGPGRRPRRSVARLLAVEGPPADLTEDAGHRQLNRRG